MEFNFSAEAIQYLIEITQKGGEGYTLLGQNPQNPKQITQGETGLERTVEALIAKAKPDRT